MNLGTLVNVRQEEEMGLLEWKLEECINDVLTYLGNL